MMVVVVVGVGPSGEINFPCRYFSPRIPARKKTYARREESRMDVCVCVCGSWCHRGRGRWEFGYRRVREFWSEGIRDNLEPKRVGKEGELFAKISRTTALLGGEWTPSTEGLKFLPFNDQQSSKGALSRMWTLLFNHFVRTSPSPKGPKGKARLGSRVPTNQ